MLAASSTSSASSRWQRRERRRVRRVGAGLAVASLAVASFAVATLALRRGCFATPADAPADATLLRKERRLAARRCRYGRGRGGGGGGSVVGRCGGRWCRSTGSACARSSSASRPMLGGRELHEELLALHGPRRTSLLHLPLHIVHRLGNRFPRARDLALESSKLRLQRHTLLLCLISRFARLVPRADRELELRFSRLDPRLEPHGLGVLIPCLALRLGQLRA